MSMDALQRIQQLHALYVELTGFEIRLDSSRENDWFLWLKAGFCEDDLKIMVHHLRKGIQAGSRQAAALKFRNLIGQPDYFEEDLAEAKARMRSPKLDPARENVLRASGREGTQHAAGRLPAATGGSPVPPSKMAAPEPPAARAVSDVIKKQFEDFKKLKDEL